MNLAAWAREGLSNFLQDLPPGAHALGDAGSLDPHEVFQACAEAADDARERLALHGVPAPHVPPHADPILIPEWPSEGVGRALQDALVAAHEDGFGGVLLVQWTDHCVTRDGPAGLILNEAFLGAAQDDALRTFCLYSPTGQRLLNLHAPHRLRRSHAFEFAAPPVPGRHHP